MENAVINGHGKAASFRGEKVMTLNLMQHTKMVIQLKEIQSHMLKIIWVNMAWIEVFCLAKFWGLQN